VATSLLGLGYAVRGAVARGSLYHKGNIVFGPCLLRAYDLEQRCAKFPRIIIDPQLSLDLSDPDDAALLPVYDDYDGLRCVNFLSPVILHVVFRLLGIPPEPRIAEIRANIDRLLSEAPGEAARTKLCWLRAYVNRALSHQPGEALIDKLVRRQARQATT
jgi:hypothetical protein